MHVTISNIKFEVENTPVGVEEMFERIDDSMKEFEVYFSHLVVDGTEVDDIPRDYVEQNLEGIRDVEVFFFTAEQYLQQVMGIMDAFLEKALPVLKEVADEFYGKPSDETWSKLDGSIKGISTLLGIINSMVSMPELTGRTERFATLGEAIGLHLENFKSAAQLNDHTLMADIIHYEIIPFIVTLHETIYKLNEEDINLTH